MKELNKVKTSIAIKCILKIILYTTLLFFFLVLVFIDGIMNNIAAELFFDFDVVLWYKMMEYKMVILLLFYIFLLAIIAFFVIRRETNYIDKIMLSIQSILNDAEEEIKLESNLDSIENVLNKIRLDLLKNREKAKEEENKKNDLIMYMAHDLKTPLTSVIGYLSLLKEEKQISKQLREKYTIIALDKALRVEELTNQFFEITKYDLHEMPVTKNKIDLSLLLDQLVEECYPMLQEKNNQIKVKKTESLLYQGDGNLLARALGNLIKNAINYSYNNTDIIIDLKRKKSNIEIIIKNKGDKIPDYKIDKLFDKFYRGDNARSSKTGGAGIGLAIAKEIVEKHGGTIRIKNDDEYIIFIVSLDI